MYNGSKRCLRLKQTILIVEADMKTRVVMKEYLTKNDFYVVEAETDEQAKQVFLQYHPCLVILDLMGHETNDQPFITWIQEQKNNEVAIIILSGNRKTSDRIAGLQMGADAYVTKPLNPHELLAHVEAVLRRTGQFCQKVTFHGITIMPRKGKVLVRDKEVKLTPHEFKLLYHLMKHSNTVFSREQLVLHIYPCHEQTVLDRTIDAHIKKLREKVEDTPSHPKRIQTVRGMGYKFVT